MARKCRLGGDPADTVRERERGAPVECRGQRHDGARDRRRRAEKHAPHHRLAEAGAVGDAVREAGHPETGEEDDNRRAEPDGGQSEKGRFRKHGRPTRPRPAPVQTSRSGTCTLRIAFARRVLQGEPR